MKKEEEKEEGTIENFKCSYTFNAANYSK